jgi:hypothetical protein
LFAICLIGGAVIAGGAVVFLIKTCKPKYYCLRNEDGDYFVSNATKREREVEGWVIVSGPYNSAEAATTNCHKPPPSALTMVSLVYTPAIPIKIWKSTNLVDWVLRDQISDDPAHFSWSETNTLGSACFYRASY